MDGRFATAAQRQRGAPVLSVKDLSFPPTHLDARSLWENTQAQMRILTNHLAYAHRVGTALPRPMPTMPPSNDIEMPMVTESMLAAHKISLNLKELSLAYQLIFTRIRPQASDQERSAVLGQILTIRTLIDKEYHQMVTLLSGILTWLAPSLV